MASGSNHWLDDIRLYKAKLQEHLSQHSIMRLAIAWSDDLEGEKSATRNFRTLRTTRLSTFLRKLNSYATVPIDLGYNGWRSTENIEKVFGWVRFDIDKEGEAELLEAEIAHLWYIKKPSTNNHKHPYKWHYLVRVRRVSQYQNQYRDQVDQFLEQQGITALSDMRVTHILVQNMNPYRDGKHRREAKKLTVVNDGKVVSLPRPRVEIIKNKDYTGRQREYHGEASAVENTSTLLAGKKNGVADKKRFYAKADYKVLTGDGWVSVAQLAGSMEDGDVTESNWMACPSCNEDHSQPWSTLGYGRAYKEDGKLFLWCGGTACRDIRITYHVTVEELPVIVL